MMESSVVRSYLQYMEPDTTQVGRVTWFLQDYLKAHEREIDREDLLYYIDELTKQVLNWIGKGEEDRLKRFSKELERIISSNVEWDEPLRGVSKFQKLGANLVFTQELINTYLDNNLELKDHQHVMHGGKVAERLRQVLLVFFAYPRRLHSIDLYNEVYRHLDEEQATAMGEDVRKLMQRDIERLVQYKLVRKIPISPKKIAYEATPRAYALNPEIQKLFYHQDYTLLNYPEAALPISAQPVVSGLHAYSPQYSKDEVLTT